MKLKVAFTNDSYSSSDIIEVIDVPEGTCLLCSHDFSSINFNRLSSEIQKCLEEKGYDFSTFFQIMKVYAI